MFKHLTKDASEVNRSVVCCQRFIAPFEGRHGICLQPVSRELACLEGSIKYDFDDRSDLFTELSQPLTTELPALKRLKNHSCEHCSAFFFDWIFFILRGEKDVSKIPHEFEF